VNINIAKDDVWWLREALRDVRHLMETSPNPSSFGKTDLVALKIIKKLNKALKEIEGHDCQGEAYIWPSYVQKN